MRLRNVKNKEELINKCENVIRYEQAINYKNHWKKYFGNDNVIELEIGTGKGNFIIEKAINNPNINYIGIEKSDSIIALASLKIHKKIPNLVFIIMDASLIDDVFSKEISTLYLNFSDPWPKKRHSLRRLTSPIYLEKYEKIFANKKKIYQKTDNRKLIEYSIMCLSQKGYRITDISLDLHNDMIEEEIVMTEYEEKFHKKGNIIYYVEYDK